MAWKQPKKFDQKQIQKLLRMIDEQDWLEFKRELKLFTVDGKVAEKARDEFIKDILGLANGNSHTIRKTKYLIVGADNHAFDENKERVRHPVNYRLPTQSEIAKWLNSPAPLLWLVWSARRSATRATGCLWSKSSLRLICTRQPAF